MRCQAHPTLTDNRHKQTVDLPGGPVSRAFFTATAKHKVRQIYHEKPCHRRQILHDDCSTKTSSKQNDKHRNQSITDSGLSHDHESSVTTRPILRPPYLPQTHRRDIFSIRDLTNSARFYAAIVRYPHTRLVPSNILDIRVSAFPRPNDDGHFVHTPVRA